jgi:hypothetical protein
MAWQPKRWALTVRLGTAALSASMAVSCGGGGGYAGIHEEGLGPHSVSVTQSAATAISEGVAIGCHLRGDNGEMSYYRVLDVAALGVPGELDVTSVYFGIEKAKTSTGVQSAHLYLYSLVGSFTLDHLTPVADAPVTIFDSDTGSAKAVPIEATLPPGSTLVVELRIPASDGFLMVGANRGGESGPTYLRAPACGVDDPTPVALLGAPSMAWVLNVAGSTP